MEEQFWIGFLQILLIDLVLSGDNAVVIGMACRGLPEKGRRLAVMYGTIGAIILRVGLTGLTTWMLDIPLVKAVGGVLLLWIAYKLMVVHDEETTDVSHSRNVSQAVKTIILADLIMSLDNVLAVGGAAHGNMWLVLFGLGLSIPLLMWGSTWVARLMNRFSMFVYIGAGILAYTAVHMCLEDPYVWKFTNQVLFNHTWLPLTVSIAIILIGRIKRLS